MSKTEASWPDEKWYYVLPGESPHTYTKLESAAAQVAERIQEDGHTWNTIAIFELYRVDSGRLEPLVQLALKKLEADADIL